MTARSSTSSPLASRRGTGRAAPRRGPGPRAAAAPPRGSGRRRTSWPSRTQDALERAQQQRLVVHDEDDAAGALRARDALARHRLGPHGGRYRRGRNGLESARRPLLPVPLSRMRSPPAGHGGARVLRDSHVLVIDDEELYRRALERILVRVGPPRQLRARRERGDVGGRPRSTSTSCSATCACPASTASSWCARSTTSSRTCPAS